MCNICGCSIDPAEASFFKKHLRCISCGSGFEASGVVLFCPSCRSRKIERVR